MSLATIITAILGFLKLLWPEKNSVADEIQLDQYKEFKDWKKQLTELENELIQLQNKTRAAQAAYIRLLDRSADNVDCCRAWLSYSKLRDECEAKFAEIRTHDARRPATGPVI